MVQKKRQEIKSSIYLSCISIKLSLTSDRVSDFDSSWNPDYMLKFSRLQFRVSVLMGLSVFSICIYIYDSMDLQFDYVCK
jgi:hypothetical protein